MKTAFRGALLSAFFRSLNRRHRSRLGWSLGLGLATLTAALPATAWAQEPSLRPPAGQPPSLQPPTTNPFAVPQRRPTLQAERAATAPWGQTLSLGLTGTINESNKVIGKRDGNTTVLGFKALSLSQYRQDQHELRNEVKFDYSTARSPYIPRYLKTEDQLSLNSLYIYRVGEAKWVGPYAQLSLKTVTSRGRDERPRERTYLIQKRDGSTTAQTGTEITLNDPWKPTIAKESVGAYFDLYGSQMLGVEFLLGLGARQVMAKHQLVSIDNDVTDEVELMELQDSNHLGPTAVFQIHGSAFTQLLTYRLVSDILFPVQSSTQAAKKRNAFSGRIVEITGDLAYKLSSWAAINYNISLLRDLDLSDDPQVNTSLMFSASYILPTGSAAAATGG